MSNFFYQKLQHPQKSIKDAEATGVAFGPEKRTSALQSKHEISLLFSMFVGHFCPPGSGSNPNADPQHRDN
jgi:hypothetical protein